ncbi:MAG: hypothetical protein AVDCRST_MAG08-1803, partial [uncultured Acetobacteraceae bacterium]
ARRPGSRTRRHRRRGRAPPGAARGHPGPRLARGRPHRGELHRRLRRHAAAAPDERAADAARQGGVRRPRRHLAPGRAPRRPRREGDHLHPWTDLRALPAGRPRGGAERARGRGPHVGAPRPEGARAGARPPAAVHRRARGAHGPAAGRHAQPPQPRPAPGVRLPLPLERLGRPPPALPAGRGRPRLPGEPALPLRHRRRDVLQLRLDGHGHRGAAHGGPGARARPVVGRVPPTVPPARRVSEHLPAPLRLRPRAAHRHARPADRAHEGAARGLVRELRGGGEALPVRPPAARRAGL